MPSDTAADDAVSETMLRALDTISSFTWRGAGFDAWLYGILRNVVLAYVTALLFAGVPLKVVSQRVGHASPTVTMTIYQHVLSGDDEAAAAVGARVILGQE